MFKSLPYHLTDVVGLKLCLSPPKKKKIYVHSEPQNVTVYGNGSLQMKLVKIDHIVLGWVLNPMTFVFIRGERHRHPEKKAMWKQRQRRN